MHARILRSAGTDRDTPDRGKTAAHKPSASKHLPDDPQDIGSHGAMRCPAPTKTMRESGITCDEQGGQADHGERFDGGLGGPGRGTRQGAPENRR